MNKKNFKATAASAFFTRAQEAAQDAAHDDAPECAQDGVQEAVQEYAQEVTQDATQAERRPLRTQGRKGKKKPRINMAFEPDVYEYIQREAERVDVSMTQLVNDILYSVMKRG